MGQFLGRATKFYAVLNAPTFPGTTDVPPGRYQVIFEPGMAISVDDHGVTYLSVFCGAGGAAAYIASGRFGPNPDYIVRAQ